MHAAAFQLDVNAQQARPIQSHAQRSSARETTQATRIARAMRGNGFLETVGCSGERTYRFPFCLHALRSPFQITNFRRYPTNLFAMLDPPSDSSLTPSPDAPPANSSGNTPPPNPNGDTPITLRVLVWTLRAATLLLIPLGLLGSLGAFALMTGDPQNPEAYEVIVAPVFAWVLSIPVLIACLLVYRMCRLSISTADKLWFIAWSVLPTAALTVAIVASLERFQ